MKIFKKKKYKRYLDERDYKRIEIGATVFTLAAVTATVALTMVAVVKLTIGG